MRALANALLDLAVFIELSGDDVVNPDAAVGAFESVAASLSAATPPEVTAIHASIRERICTARSEKERLFYIGVAEDLNLTPDS